MTDLPNLITKLEGVSEPSRELDTAIHDALFPARPGIAHDSMGRPTTLPAGWGRGLTDPAYTSSVDAALALIERVLPGWCVVNCCEWEDDRLRSKGPWMAQLRVRGAPMAVNKASCMNAASPALALCIACLKALQSNEVENG